MNKSSREVHTDARAAREINVSIVGGICRHLSTCCSKEISALWKRDISMLEKERIQQCHKISDTISDKSTLHVAKTIVLNYNV